DPALVVGADGAAVLRHRRHHAGKLRPAGAGRRRFFGGDRLRVGPSRRTGGGGARAQSGDCGGAGRMKEGQGAALKPARGLCPLDPHQRRAFGIHSFGWGEGGGCLGPVWAAVIAPAIAAAQTGPRHPPPSPQPTKGFQGPAALGGSPEGSALWWGPGAKPLAFLHPIALCRGIISLGAIRETSV